MIRKIIHIDQELCNGCGLCVTACHEGAIALVEGKARLIRDDYCDGLGNCLPVCPAGAITFEEREAAAYDEAAVLASMSRPYRNENPATGSYLEEPAMAAPRSQLRQWPVQIKLVPVNAPCFKGAHLLIAADCTAYSYGDFHTEFMRDRIILIGCPKLDEVDYSEKLTAILRENEIKSVMVVRMEVPCCKGMEIAVKIALRDCGKMIPWQTAVISIDGRLLEV